MKPRQTKSVVVVPVTKTIVAVNKKAAVASSTARTMDSCLQVSAVRATKTQKELDQLASSTMDADLWCNFPDILIEDILPRLPLPSLFRFRTVCKAWNALIQEPRFLTACGRSAASNANWGNSWFYFSASECSNDGLTFDPEGPGKWYKIPKLFAGLLGHDGFSLCAAHGGLACFISKFDARGYMTLAVCNPLTNSWRTLPPMLEMVLLIAAGMVVDKDNNYKVMVSGIHRTVDTMQEGGHGRREVYKLVSTTQLYDTQTDCWRESGAVQPGNYRSVAIACNGNLYAWCYVADILVKFDPATEVWSQVFAQKHRSFQIVDLGGYPSGDEVIDCSSHYVCGEFVVARKGLNRLEEVDGPFTFRNPMRMRRRCYKLVECGGKLMMVAGLRRSISSTSICLLELTTTTTISPPRREDASMISADPDDLTMSWEWVRVGRCMPTLLCEQLLGYGPDVRCVGAHALVLMYAVQRRQLKMLLVCELRKRTWRRMPLRPMTTLPTTNDKAAIHAVAFEPRLDVVV